MRVCVHHACNDCAHYRDRTLMHTHTQPNIYVRDPRTSNLPSLVMRLVSRRENSSGCGNTTAASATKIDPPSYTPGYAPSYTPGWPLRTCIGIFSASSWDIACNSALDSCSRSSIYDTWDGMGGCMHTRTQAFKCRQEVRDKGRVR